MPSTPEQRARQERLRNIVVGVVSFLIVLGAIALYKRAGVRPETETGGRATPSAGSEPTSAETQPPSETQAPAETDAPALPPPDLPSASAAASAEEAPPPPTADPSVEPDVPPPPATAEPVAPPPPAPPPPASVDPSLPLPQQIMAALEAGNPGQAVGLARQLTAQSPGSPNAWYLRGAAEQAAGQGGKASFRKCAELAPPDSAQAVECAALAN